MTTNEATQKKNEGHSGWSFDKVVSALHFLSVPTHIPLGRVVLDSREIQKGDIFVALKGERHDSHDFLQQAYDNGAGLALVERGDIPLLEKHSYLCVQSTRQALIDLAEYARANTAATVIAVSGSVGKTTVRTWIYRLLEEIGSSVMSLCNFNGRIGLPLSMTRLEPETRFGVFEIGIDAPDSMVPLAKLCQPHVAVLTSIGAAHIGNFSSLEDLAKEKAQVFTGLCPGGMAIVDFESHQKFPILKQTAHEAGVDDFITVGRQEEANVRLVDVQVDSLSTHVMLDIIGWQVEYEIGAVGEALAQGSALALTAAIGSLYAGRLVDIISEHKEELKECVLPALTRLSALPGRGEIFSVTLPGGRDITLLDDAYNANPASMMVGLQALEHQRKGRRIAIIGDMLDLGASSEALHQELFDRLAASSVDKVIAIGPMTKAPFSTLPPAQQGAWLPTKDGLLELLMQECQSNDCLWLKASHAIGLHEIASALKSNKLETLAA